MRRILLASAFMLICLAVSAQSLTYGPKIGINLTNLSINDIGGYAVKNPMRAGLSIGGFATYNYGGMISSQIELLYSSQGTMLKDGDGSMGKIKLDYINIPMLSKFNVFGNLNVNIGLQVGFLINKKFKGNAQALRRDMKFHTADLAIPMGISYDFPIGLTLDLRYNLGLINSVKSYADRSMKSKNGVLQISGAWRF